jgi:hypothetical protein
MVRGMLVEAQRQADEALAATIAEAMKVDEPPKPEPSGPYLDDNSRLRKPVRQRGRPGRRVGGGTSRG